MKQVFTCSLDEQTVEKLRTFTRSSSFRNKSHVVEQALLKFLKDEGEK
ncbi:hypothetical protein HYV86_03715 [Candidatus Woesearchaeota archaeon]|nr:hypothetical protein [Candidatus Woesearchaeota archaeon]